MRQFRCQFVLLVLLSMSSVVWAGTLPPMSACLNGKELYIASNDGSGTEICMCFRPCMANKLMSFSHVGAREVSRTMSDCSKLFGVSGMTWFNIASSDNIGPVAIKGYSNYVGGNHLWKKADSKGKKGAGKLTSIFTAKTDSFVIRVDGKRLPESVAVSCHKVAVEVWNTLFDPTINPDDGATMLSSPLITEHVTYLVEYNTINVEVEHKYLKNVTINRYNGMQSAFRNETLVMTPDGVYSDWMSADSVYRFAKNKYPHLNHFIERNANGWCQTTFLLPNGLGNHQYLPETYAIFLYSSKKSYHVLMAKTDVAKGGVNMWEGCYVWSLPFIDNDFVTINKGMRDGRALLFVDAKKAGTFSFTRPEWWMTFDDLVLGQGLDISSDGNTVTITSTQPTGAVLLARTSSVYELGDVNCDEKIDIADMNLLIDLVLGKVNAKGFDAVADLNGDGEFDVSDVNRLIDIILGK